MNIVWIVNDVLRMLRRCGWMWMNSEELKEVGNSLVIY